MMGDFEYVFMLICLVDYVYFEGNPSDPYLIRRIEELNKVCLRLS